MRHLRAVKRLISGICFLGVMSLLLALCDIADAQNLEKTRLGISDLSFTFLPHLIAKDAGIFQKHGLQVELIFIGGPVGSAALAAGELN